MKFWNGSVEVSAQRRVTAPVRDLDVRLSKKGRKDGRKNIPDLACAAWRVPAVEELRREAQHEIEILGAGLRERLVPLDRSLAEAKTNLNSKVGALDRLLAEVAAAEQCMVDISARRRWKSLCAQVGQARAAVQAAVASVSIVLAERQDVIAEHRLRGFAVAQFAEACAAVYWQSNLAVRRKKETKHEGNVVRLDLVLPDWLISPSAFEVDGVDSAGLAEIARG